MIIAGKPMRLADPTENPASQGVFKFCHSASSIVHVMEKTCEVYEYEKRVRAILEEARQSELACLQRRSYNYLSEDLLTKESGPGNAHAITVVLSLEKHAKRMQCDFIA